jgi:hypothetical protein
MENNNKIRELYSIYLELGHEVFEEKIKNLLTRVNSTNVLNEGLRIGEIGRRMNSKVRLVEIGVYQK